MVSQWLQALGAANPSGQGAFGLPTHRARVPWGCQPIGPGCEDTGDAFPSAAEGLLVRSAERGSPFAEISPHADGEPPMNLRADPKADLKERLVPALPMSPSDSP